MSGRLNLQNITPTPSALTARDRGIRNVFTMPPTGIDYSAVELAVRASLERAAFCQRKHSALSNRLRKRRRLAARCIELGVHTAFGFVSFLEAREDENLARLIYRSGAQVWAKKQRHTGFRK